jgi:hypothetical protein
MEDKRGKTFSEKVSLFMGRSGCVKQAKAKQKELAQLSGRGRQILLGY